MTIINITEKRIANYIETIRPRAEIRDQLDIGYSFKKNEIIIFEIRPLYTDKTKIAHYPYARAKYVQTQKVWKIYWKRASGKWELYEPCQEVKNIDSFIEVIEEDSYGCFKG